ncbi:MAG: hypothetical protein IH600_14285 [Bacteroidetes bacterium]|nr:hypothetical protein [Bacteroidota bacterium]
MHNRSKNSNFNPFLLLRASFLLLFLAVQIAAPMHGTGAEDNSRPHHGCRADAGHADVSPGCSHDRDTDGCKDTDCGNCCGHCCQHTSIQSLLPADDLSLPSPMLAITEMAAQPILQGDLPVPFLPPRA